MFFKIGVLKHFSIFTRKHLSWNYFLIKFQACRPAILSKRDFNTDVFSECCEIFKHIFFQEHLRAAASIFKSESQYYNYWASADLLFLIKNNVGWFLLRRFVDLIRVYSLLITSGNHSNRFMIDLQKTKTCPK